MTRVRISSVYSHGQRDRPTAAEAEAAKAAARREAWQRFGLAVLDPAEIEGEWLREGVIAEVTRLYGKRGK